MVCSTFMHRILGWGYCKPHDLNNMRITCGYAFDERRWFDLDWLTNGSVGMVQNGSVCKLFLASVRANVAPLVFISEVPIFYQFRFNCLTRDHLLQNIQLPCNFCKLLFTLRPLPKPRDDLFQFGLHVMVFLQIIPVGYTYPALVFGVFVKF